MNTPLATPISHQSSERLLSGQLARAGVLIWNDVTDEGRDDFYRWHTDEHMPERMSITGFIRARRYANPGQSPQWFTLYEARSVDVLTSTEYLARLNNPTPATTSTLKHFRRTARSVCTLQRAHGLGVGGYLVVVRFDAVGAVEMGEALSDVGNLLARIDAMLGVVASSLYRGDQGASLIDTAESQTRAFDVAVMTLVVDVTHEEAAKAVFVAIREHEWSGRGLKPRAEPGIYQLEICMNEGVKNT